MGEINEREYALPVSSRAPARSQAEPVLTSGNFWHSGNAAFGFYARWVM
jgi:hypothetical protein